MMNGTTLCGMEAKQLSMIEDLDAPEYWEEEWQCMPEFVQEKEEPYCTIKIRIGSEEELQEFAALIGQKLTNKTKSIWHPELVRGKHSHKIYVQS